MIVFSEQMPLIIKRLHSTISYFEIISDSDVDVNTFAINDPSIQWLEKGNEFRIKAEFYDVIFIDSAKKVIHALKDEREGFFVSNTFSGAKHKTPQIHLDHFLIKEYDNPQIFENRYIYTKFSNQNREIILALESPPPENGLI